MKITTGTHKVIGSKITRWNNLDEIKNLVNEEEKSGVKCEIPGD